MVISHDRWFLDRIATHMLAFEGDSHVEWFEGNYQDYEADRKRRLGDDALDAPPHQVQEAGSLTRKEKGASGRYAGGALNCLKSGFRLYLFRRRECAVYALSGLR
jgi:hypothetical protein